MAHLLRPVAAGLGLLGLFGGIAGVTNPNRWATVFGIPEHHAATAAPPASLSARANPNPFVEAAAVRNLVGGITLLTYCLTGQIKAASLFLLCGSLTGLADSRICAKNNSAKSKIYGHAFFGVLAGLLGGALYWCDTA